MAWTSSPEEQHVQSLNDSVRKDQDVWVPPVKAAAQCERDEEKDPTRQARSHADNHVWKCSNMPLFPSWSCGVNHTKATAKSTELEDRLLQAHFSIVLIDNIRC